MVTDQASPDQPKSVAGNSFSRPPPISPPVDRRGDLTRSNPLTNPFLVSSSDLTSSDDEDERGGPSSALPRDEALNQAFQLLRDQARADPAVLRALQACVASLAPHQVRVVPTPASLSGAHPPSSPRRPRAWADMVEEDSPSPVGGDPTADPEWMARRPLLHRAPLHQAALGAMADQAKQVNDLRRAAKKQDRVQFTQLHDWAGSGGASSSSTIPRPLDDDPDDIERFMDPAVRLRRSVWQRSALLTEPRRDATIGMDLLARDRSFALPSDYEAMRTAMVPEHIRKAKFKLFSLTSKDWRGLTRHWADAEIYLARNPDCHYTWLLSADTIALLCRWYNDYTKADFLLVDNLKRMDLGLLRHRLAARIGIVPRDVKAYFISLHMGDLDVDDKAVESFVDDVRDFLWFCLEARIDLPLEPTRQRLFAALLGHQDKYLTEENLRVKLRKAAPANRSFYKLLSNALTECPTMSLGRFLRILSKAAQDRLCWFEECRHSGVDPVAHRIFFDADHAWDFEDLDTINASSQDKQDNKKKSKPKDRSSSKHKPADSSSTTASALAGGEEEKPRICYGCGRPGHSRTRCLYKGLSGWREKGKDTDKVHFADNEMAIVRIRHKRMKEGAPVDEVQRIDAVPASVDQPPSAPAPPSVKTKAPSDKPSKDSKPVKTAAKDAKDSHPAPTEDPKPPKKKPKEARAAVADVESLPVDSRLPEVFAGMVQTVPVTVFPPVVTTITGEGEHFQRWVDLTLPGDTSLLAHRVRCMTLLDSGCKANLLSEEAGAVALKLGARRLPRTIQLRGIGGLQAVQYELEMDITLRTPLPHVHSHVAHALEAVRFNVTASPHVGFHCVIGEPILKDHREWLLHDDPMELDESFVPDVSAKALPAPDVVSAAMVDTANTISTDDHDSASADDFHKMWKESDGLYYPNPALDEGGIDDDEAYDLRKPHFKHYEVLVGQRRAEVFSLLDQGSWPHDVDEWKRRRDSGAMSTQDWFFCHHWRLLRDNPSVFTKALTPLNKMSDEIRPLSVEWLPGIIPPKTPNPRWVNQAKKDLIESTLEQMMTDDVVRFGECQYASPIVFIRKKDGQGWRVCVDYYVLNDYIKPMVYPIPEVSEMCTRLSGHAWMFVVDFYKGYWQMGTCSTDDTRKILGIICHLGTLQQLRAPMGLAPSMAHFNAEVNRLFEALKREGLLIYVDDMSSGDDDPDRLLSRFERMVARCKELGFTLHPDKVILGATQVIYLGHHISKDGVAMDPERVRAIQDIPVPKNVRALRSWVGKLQIFRNCVPNLGIHLARFTKKFKKDLEFKWLPEDTEAFHAVNRLLLSTTLRMAPTNEGRLILRTDASNEGIGAVLAQRIRTDDGVKEYPIWFVSHAFSDVESRWPTVEQECYAIYYALTKMDMFIAGRHPPVLVLTDHANLVWWSMLKNNKVMRWLFALKHLDFAVQHIAGSDNITADALSRHILGKDPDLLPDSLPERQALMVLPADDEDVEVLTDKRAIFDRFHNLTVGHYGATTTKQRIIDGGYRWTNMDKDIHEWVKSCAVCQKVWRGEAPAQSVWKSLASTSLLASVHFDWMQSVPEDATSHHDSIAVAICAFSGRVWLSSHRGITAETTIAALVNMFGAHIFPQELRMDQASPHVSEAVRHFAAVFGINITLTVAHRHSSNGLAERAIQDIERHLRSWGQTIPDFRHNWSWYLQFMAGIMNNKRNTRHGYTPNEVLFGKSVSHSMQSLYARSHIPPITEHVLHPTIEQYRVAHNTILDHLRDFQQARIDQAKGEFEAAAEADKGLWSFAEGDLVLLSPPDGVRHTDKIASRWSGPYACLAYSKGSTATIQHTASLKVSTVDAHRLKRFYLLPDVNPQEVARLDQGRFFVERILNYRRRPGASARSSNPNDIQFRVHWKGYPEAEATWEPFEALRELTELQRFRLLPRNRRLNAVITAWEEKQAVAPDDDVEEAQAAMVQVQPFIHVPACVNQDVATAFHSVPTILGELKTDTLAFSAFMNISAASDWESLYGHNYQTFFFSHFHEYIWDELGLHMPLCVDSIAVLDSSVPQTPHLIQLSSDSTFSVGDHVDRVRSLWWALITPWALSNIHRGLAFNNTVGAILAPSPHFVLFPPSAPQLHDAVIWPRDSILPTQPHAVVSPFPIYPMDYAGHHRQHIWSLESIPWSRYYLDGPLPADTARLPADGVRTAQLAEILQQPFWQPRSEFDSPRPLPPLRLANGTEADPLLDGSDIAAITVRLQTQFQALASMMAATTVPVGLSPSLWMPPEHGPFTHTQVASFNQFRQMISTCIATMLSHVAPNDVHLSTYLDNLWRSKTTLLEYRRYLVDRELELRQLYHIARTHGYSLPSHDNPPPFLHPHSLLQATRDASCPHNAPLLVPTWGIGLWIESCPTQLSSISPSLRFSQGSSLQPLSSAPNSFTPPCPMPELPPHNESPALAILAEWHRLRRFRWAFHPKAPWIPGSIQQDFSYQIDWSHLLSVQMSHWASSGQGVLTSLLHPRSVPSAVRRKEVIVVGPLTPSFADITSVLSRLNRWWTQTLPPPFTIITQLPTGRSLTPMTAPVQDVVMPPVRSLARRLCRLAPRWIRAAVDAAKDRKFTSFVHFWEHHLFDMSQSARLGWIFTTPTPPGSPPPGYPPRGVMFPNFALNPPIEPMVEDGEEG